MQHIKKNYFLFGVLFLFILAIPLTISSIQKPHELQSHASGELPLPAAVCANASADIMLVTDISGSMNDKTSSSSTTKLSDAISAANKFVDIIGGNTNNHIGLTSFATTAILNNPLTNIFSAVKTNISKLTANGNTCVQCGTQTSSQEVTKDGRQNIKKVAILLTDGLANTISGSTKQVPQQQAEAAALTTIKNDFAANKTVYFTIGLGADVNAAFLQQIALTTGGKYYFSPNSSDLTQIYQNISQIIGKGSVSGFVFTDSNNNGQFDTGETKLPNWSIDLTVGTASAQPIATTTTDSSGNYSFPELCDGSYFVSENQQTGWTQTVPINPDYYIAHIGTGSAETDKNFGNIQRTPTPSPSPTITPSPTPGTTTLDINVFLHSIGNGGDNATSAASLSNKNPLHPDRSAHVYVYDASNQEIVNQMGTIHYSSVSGSFIGQITIDKAIPTDKYYVKIASDFHLRRLIAGIQTIIEGSINKIPPVYLVAGDADNDNELSLLDYNLLLGCYSVLQPAAACNDQWKVATDFNDDGFVDGTDYNIFIRELSVQAGQ